VSPSELHVKPVVTSLISPFWPPSTVTVLTSVPILSSILLLGLQIIGFPTRIVLSSHSNCMSPLTSSLTITRNKFLQCTLMHYLLWPYIFLSTLFSDTGSTNTIPAIMLPNSTEQSPTCEADSNSAGRDILRLLWNPNVHYRVHICVLLAPILSQLHPFHTFPHDFCKIHFNIILPYTIRLPSSILPSDSPTKHSLLPSMLRLIPISLSFIWSP